MNDKILVITDNSKGRWVGQLSRHIGKRPHEVSILTLGITPDYFIKSTPYRSKVFDNYRFVNVDDVSEDIQRRIREFYINFIFELPQKCKKGAFFSKGENLWWFLDITEKDPFHSKIIYRLFYLDLVREVIERDSFHKIYIDLNDHLLSETLAKWKPNEIKDISANIFAKYKPLFRSSFLYFIYRYSRNSFGVFLLFLMRTVALKINRVDGARPPQKEGVFFYTNYPYWWNSPCGGKASEKFFGFLPERLANDHPVFYAAWLFSLNPLKIFFKRDFFRHFFIKKNMIILEHMLKAKDIAGILSFRYFLWALSVRRYYGTSFKSKFYEFDITKFVYHEICRSVTSAGLFNNILLKDAFKKFSEKYFPRTIIYRLEFNPFEKAMLKGVSRRCKTISFQHATLSPNLMSHFFAPGEIAFHLSENNASLAMPLPDIILTTGSYFRDIMIKTGFPNERIDICGPVRYCNLVSYLKENRQKAEVRKKLGFNDSEKIFLVIMGWIEKEDMALIASLAEVQKGMDEKPNFILRSHPHSRYDKKISSFFKSANSNFRYSFLNDEFSLYDAISISDAVIEVPTAVGYESMAIGKMPIVYMNRHIFNVNSSEELNGCAYIVDSSAELKAAMHSILYGDEKIYHMMHEWPRILESFFSDLKNDPQQRFIGLLQKYKMLN